MEPIPAPSLLAWRLGEGEFFKGLPRPGSARGSSNPGAACPTFAHALTPTFSPLLWFEFGGQVKEGT
jgi:hypothetical protein